MGTELIAFALMGPFGVMVLLPLVLPSLVTGYCAYSYGRSFWLWFLLGGLAPGVALGCLIALLRRKELHPGEQLVATARAILAETQDYENALLQEAQRVLLAAEATQALRYKQAAE